jgi:mRNA interferase RelE/StbE
VSYQIELRPAAIRALKRIDHKERDRVRGAISLLGADPRPPAATALRGRPGFRVSVGDHRIIYTNDDGVLMVAVVMLGHRRDVYDR